MGFLTLILFITCNVVYLLTEVKTFTERTRSIFVQSAAVLVILALLILILNEQELFQFFNDFENIVNTSE